MIININCNLVASILKSLHLKKVYHTSTDSSSAIRNEHVVPQYLDC